MMSCRPSQAHTLMLCRQQSRQPHQQKRTLFGWTTVSPSTASLSSSTPWQSISGLSSSEHEQAISSRHNNINNQASAHAAIQYQQVRWKRRDGNRFAFQSQNAKTTKKQRKRYNQLQKQERMQREKHNPPGSRAAVHKQYLQEFENWNREEEQPGAANRYQWTPERLQDYTVDDALLDDFMHHQPRLAGVAGASLTPIPQYVGHLQQSFFNDVADQMEEYREAKNKNLQIQQQLQQLQLTTASASKGEEPQQQPQDSDMRLTTPPPGALVGGDVAAAAEWTEHLPDLLPTDSQISLALRAYRDKHGTRQKPIGLVRALSHLIQDLDIPMSTPPPRPPTTTSITSTSKKNKARSSSDDGTTSPQEQQEKHRGWGEYTYTTLLTCCHTPAEGRRVFQIMKEQQHPLSSYSWNILMDLHAKVGDYEGCIKVQEEMMAHSGIRPTVVSYTTILAACYKVCVDTSRIPHAIRSKAAKMAWTKWQEMRIAAIQPDVMAYGAMLRILAATGQPERAVNLLEEMLQHQDPPIQPTTLCFTSALKAVAKSHTTAIRFERGSSRRNVRREFITAHHGKLAQQIVILAEQYSVPQDDGFVAAIVSCAAAAGDVATAKAIYVAHQIRSECDFLRTIGPNEHLEQLRSGHSSGSIGNGGFHDDDETATLLGGNEVDLHLPSGTAHSSGQDIGIKYGNDSGVSTIDELQGASSSSSSTPAVNNNISEVDPPRKKKRTHEDKVQLFQEREYGKDSRVVSAILHACATAADPNGMGTLWQGRENHGYLCINSLRLLTARRLPRYSDESIPGASRTDNLTWHGEDKDDDYRNGKRTKGRSNAKARANVYVDENSAATIDDLDEAFGKMFLDENGQRKPQFQRLTFEEVWKLKYQHNRKKIDNTEHVALQQAEGFVVHNSNKKKSDPTKALSSSTSSSSSFEEPSVDEQEELYFCYDSMRWEKRPKAMMFEQVTPEVVGEAGMNQDGSVNNGADSFIADEDDDESSDEMYFDSNLMQWSTRTKVAESSPVTPRASADVERKTPRQAEDVLYFDANDMKWKTRPRLESEAAGLSEFEAKVLISNDKHSNVVANENERSKSTGEEALFADFYRDLKNEMEQSGEVIDNATEDEARELFFALRSMGDGGDTDAEQDDIDSMNETSDDDTDSDSDSDSEYDDMDNEHMLAKIDNTTEAFAVAGVDDYDAFEVDEELVQLREMLPAFSDKRLRKIQKAFHGSLHDPSLLDLALVVRESMPDFITNTWLKQMSLLTAKHIVAKAAQDGLVDSHVLDKVLELEAAAGSLDRALEFHQTEYKKYQLTPNGFSDRLMVQMFVKHNRFQRALIFKEKIEEASRSLDIPSYGALVDYCARHNQLGSAVILLKECIDLHGSPPPEASLSQLRILCRQHDLVDALHLTKLIGKDPTEWLRYGEAHLKREMSKRGRRDVRLARAV